MNNTGDLDSQSGQDALKIIENTCKFQEQFYDWSVSRDKGIDAVKEYIQTNSTNGIVYIEYQYKQLGKDEAWFKRICQLIDNPLKVKREVFLKRMRGSSESPYEPEDLALIEEKKGKIKEEIFINGLFKLDIYKQLIKERIYFVGVDIADGYGAGRDNSTVIIFDPYDLEPVAEFKSPYINPIQFGNFLISLIRKHIPRGILCIERNRGAAIIAQIKQSQAAPNLYFDKKKDLVGGDIDEKLDPKGFLQREAERSRYYGIYTGQESRKVMFGLLEVHVREFKDKFVTETLINELMSLVKTKTGRIEAAPGFHDDMVLAYLMCLYVYYHGNNLHKYGFVKGALPSDEERNKGLTYEDNLNRLPSDIQDKFSRVGTQDQSDYDKKLVAEIQKARIESERINRLLNPINLVENYETSEVDDVSIDLNMFDDLND